MLPWIIDTHVHDSPPPRRRLLYDLQGSSAGGSPDGGPSVQSGLSDLLADMDRARVGTSFVALSDATEEFLRLARLYPNRLFGLAPYDPFSPRQGLDRICELCASHPTLIAGVTFTIPSPDQDPRRNEFTPLYEYCMRHDLPIQFCSDGSSAEGRLVRPSAFAVLARTFPPLKVVYQYAGSWDENATEYLHSLPNLFLQVAALPQTKPDGSPGTLQALLREVSSRKIVFASDWRGRHPVYFERVEGVRRLPFWYRRNIGWRTAARVYGPRISIPERLKADG